MASATITATNTNESRARRSATPAQRLRRQARVGDLAGHPDREREVGEVEVVRLLVVVEVDSADWPAVVDVAVALAKTVWTANHDAATTAAASKISSAFTQPSRSPASISVKPIATRLATLAPSTTRSADRAREIVRRPWAWCRRRRCACASGRRCTRPPRPRSTAAALVPDAATRGTRRQAARTTAATLRDPLARPRFARRSPGAGTRSTRTKSTQSIMTTRRPSWRQSHIRAAPGVR